MISRGIEPVLPATRSSGWLVMLVFLLISGGLILFVRTALIGHEIIAMLLFVLILAVAVHLFAKIAFQRTIDLLEPVHWVLLYALIGYVGAPLYMLSTGHVSYLIRGYGQDEQTQLMALALIYVLVGLASFYIGYSTLLARRIGARLPAFRSAWSSHRVRHVVILFTIIGITCFIVYAHYGGGILYLYKHPELRWYIFCAIPAAGYLVWGVRFLPLATYIWFVDHSTVRRSRIFWLYSVAVSGILLAFGGRARVLSMWITLIILRHYLIKRLSLKGILGVIGLAIIFLFLFSLLLRGDSGEAFKHTNYLLSGEYFGGIAPFMHILKHIPKELGPYWGQTFASLIFFPIPRALWPDKPVVAGTLILQPFFPNQPGAVGVPLIAELYLNFLLPGIVIGMFLFGVISRALYAYLKKNVNSRASVLIYAAVFIHWIVGLTCADFVTTTVPVLENLLSLGIALYYITRVGDT